MKLVLRKMTEAEFVPYLQAGIVNYAEAKQRSDKLTWIEAEKLSRASYELLLPQGIQTLGQYLFSVVEKASNRPVGILWFGIKKGPQAFIYDIELDAEHRGKGYGKETLALAELEARALGVKSIGLHVFEYNTNAIGLYEKTGFRTTDRVMVKDL